MTLQAGTRWVACRVCQGPARAGYARCYQCDSQRSEAGSLLADSVVAVGYAVKGGQLASDLWRYKHDRPDAASAERLRAMLRDFLRDHGPCVRPATRVAVVPSGRGRPGAHPLAGIVASCVRLPMVALSAGPQAAAHGREVSPGWLRVRGDAEGVTGASVLVVDDTWVSGGSAQSVAVALKRAGAARVTIMVLGRHLDLADPRTAAFAGVLAGGAPAGRPAHACLRG
jgi:hypothetical protein